jgi:hypothetical protein
MDKDNAAIFMGSDEEGDSFTRDDSILNYRPVIEFVEPPQIEDTYSEATEPSNEIEDARSDMTEIINGLNDVVKLADIAQQRIDARVTALGGVTIKLDPLKDQIAIAAMKRRFPDKKDPTQITYDDYKKAVACLAENVPAIPTLSAEDILAAKTDPLRTDFGGAGNQGGENRPEISSPLNSIEPVDMGSFQNGALLALFAKLLPMILGIKK